MRVLIADDHEIMRKSISSILQSRTDVRICGEAANGKEAVSKTQLLNPDLLILDISFLAGFERMNTVMCFQGKGLLEESANSRWSLREQMSGPFCKLKRCDVNASFRIVKVIS